MNDLSPLGGKVALITGAAGMLGRAFVEALAVVPGGCRTLALTHNDLDITDRAAVLARSVDRPDIIIHCAAWVDAEGCEGDPQRCRRVQVDGTENIAELATRTGARVLYPQSFLVFDGTENPIVEATRPNPLSHYGRVKWEAEQRLVASHPEALVVRMAGFFGGDEKDKNFVGKFTRHLGQLIAQSVSSYDVGDRVWQPTYTLDLARNALLLLAMERTGVYNMSCQGSATFHDVASACVTELGLAGRFHVVPVTENIVSKSEKAKRPPAGIMENRRLVAEGLDRQRPWRQALSEYLARPWFKNLFAASVECKE